MNFRHFILLLGLSVSWAQFALSTPIPCEKWQNGKCLHGPLSKLSKAFAQAQSKAGESSPVCQKLCTDACPKCEYCSYCKFCDWYHEKACTGHSYYTDKETCTEKVTSSCCELCKSQCETKGGACTSSGICKGGDSSQSTLVYCVEKTGQTCSSCKPEEIDE